MNWARTAKLSLSLLLAFLAVVLGGLSVHRKVRSFQPLGFEAAPAGGGLVVERVSDPRTGLRVGDQILIIQGSEIAGPAALEGLREQPQTMLTVLRDGELVSALTYHRPKLAVDLPYLVLALIGVLYLLIGLYTLLRQSDRQGFLFFLWTLVSAVFYLLSPVTGTPDLVYRVVYVGDEIARILLPALTLHLLLVFPTPVADRVRRLIPFLYLPAAALVALQIDLAAANGRWLIGRPTTPSLLRLDRLEMAHFVAFTLASVALLALRMMRERGWERQRQVQWMAVGFGGGYLPFLLLCGIPEVFGLRGPQLVSVAGVLPLALVPLAFAWAILRYKLWDIEVMVRDTMSLTLTLLLGILGFSLVNLGILRGISPELSAARNLLSFVAGLAIAGLLVPTRKGLAHAFERLQYGRSFGRRRALTRLGRELLLERDLGKLCAALLQEIEAGVELERVDLYLIQSASLVTVRPAPGLPETLPLDLLEGSGLSHRLRLAGAVAEAGGTEGSGTVQDGLEDGLREALWQRPFVRFYGFALPGELETPEQRLFAAGCRYAFPLTVRGKAVSLVLTGFRLGPAPLNSDDTELIRHLLDQAALAIENAQLVGQLHRQLDEVRSLQRYTEGIFESSPAGIAVLDPAGIVLSANGAFAAICGGSAQTPATRAGLLGRPLAELLPLSTLPGCGEGPVEVTFRDAAGGDHHLQVSVADFTRVLPGAPEAGGELRVLVVHDVSERVAMEAALQEKERLAALGMLAAGVAHEVNTPITGISSYAQMLLTDTPESDPRYDILKKVERQTFRASRIVNNLLEFARDRQKDRKPVALAPLLRETVDLLAERLEKRRVEIVWELPEEPVCVLGCEGELQQVLTNLLVNAFDAVAPAGPAAAQSRGRITLSVDAGAERAQVRVADNGPGIPADKLETIFQPFYSTKLNRGGTGLGLSISAEIVRRHGGELRAGSPVGGGACFVVDLPRHRV